MRYWIDRQMNGFTTLGPFVTSVLECNLFKIMKFIQTKNSIVGVIFLRRWTSFFKTMKFIQTENSRANPENLKSCCWLKITENNWKYTKTTSEAPFHYKSYHPNTTHSPMYHLYQCGFMLFLDALASLRPVLSLSDWVTNVFPICQISIL